MTDYNLKKGYDIRIAGHGELRLKEMPDPDHVALQPIEFRGIKPKLSVHEGDTVKIGTPLFTDKSLPDLKFVSPVSGTVDQIKRGERRALMEIIVKNNKKNDAESLPAYSEKDISNLKREEIVAHLLKGGMWPYIRQRPFNNIADQTAEPRDIFISAFDTAPLAANQGFLLQGQEKDFQNGIDVLNKLTEGKVHLSLQMHGDEHSRFLESVKGVELHRFNGPHPAGNVGVQIHHISPIKRGEMVWYVRPAAVAHIGKFFTTGKFPNERIISTAGSSLRERIYYKTILGAPISSIIEENNLVYPDSRFINGNVLTGRKISSKGYTGFYDSLLTVIPEGRKKKTMFEYALPGTDKESFSNTFLSKLLGKKEFEIDTRMKGGHRAFVTTGPYERVLPMDIYPVQLIKSVMAEDIEEMENLGILECDEEDLALCSYICPSKTDFGGILREGLDLIEKEG